jgi:hypothetical protein
MKVAHFLSFRSRTRSWPSPTKETQCCIDGKSVGNICNWVRPFTIQSWNFDLKCNLFQFWRCTSLPVTLQVRTSAKLTGVVFSETFRVDWCIYYYLIPHSTIIVAEAWLIAQEPYLLSRELGHTIDEVENLIKKHEAFEKSASAQEERFTALERLTTVSWFHYFFVRIIDETSRNLLGSSTFH